MEHLEVAAQAIKSLGGASAVARLRGRTPWAISKWMRNGIPADEVLWLAGQTGWSFTPHDLAPAIYPNVTDGLPPGEADRRQLGMPGRKAAVSVDLGRRSFLPAHDEL